MKNYKGRLQISALFLIAIGGAAVAGWSFMTHPEVTPHSHPVVGSLGAPVNSADGRYLGRVLDFTTGAEGRPEYLIILQGGRERLSTVMRIVPWSTVMTHRPDGGLTLSVSAAKFFGAPRYSSTSEISQEEELPRIQAYFGAGPVPECPTGDAHRKS